MINIVKRKIHDKINFNEILNRLKSVYGLSGDKQLSELFDISQQDLSNRKRRGTLLPLIIKHSLNQNINLHWLITGEGSRCLLHNLDLIRTLKI